ncbi:MAG: CDP-alcohol phosphatidyltransferase family protein [Puniceicoccaceae bacterium]
MPTVYQLKPAFQNLLRPMTRFLARKGVTANQVTIFAAVLSALEGLWIYLQPTNPAALLGLPVVLFLRMALNAIDGMLAREHGQKSNLGGVLNELGDIVSDTCLYLPFVAHPAMSPLLVVAFVLLAILTECTGLTLASLGGGRRYEGPMGKSDRALFWGVVGFLAAIGVGLTSWINWALAVAIALLVYTVINRTRKGLAELESAT